MKRTFLLAILTLSATIMAVAQVGTWKAYMAYHDITDVQKVENTLYVLASNSLYTYNTNDKSIQTYDKTNGLSDCEIKYIAWCQSAKRLLIAYSNGNFDIMDSNGEITNLPDFYNKTMTEDKTINDINIYGKYAYISTGFGILKIDVANAEIQETYNLGFNVNYSYIQDGKVFAASSAKGIYTASLNDNMQDPTLWIYTVAYTANKKTVDQELLDLAETLNPGGPKYNYFGFIKYANDKLYTCGGVQNNIIKGTIQVLHNGDWEIYQDEGIKDITGINYQNIYAIDIDPLDNTHVFAGGMNGLYEFKNNSFVKYYDHQNSLIESYNGKSNEYQIIYSVIFDDKGSLFMLNSQSPTQSIIEMTKDGEWLSHKKSTLMKLDDGQIKNKSLGYLTNMISDSQGYIWFVNNHWTVPSFYCYMPKIDSLLSFVPKLNQDGTAIEIAQGIRCIAEDAEGNLWIGTSAGPIMLNKSDIMSESPTYNQVKVPRNDGSNLADYLLSSVDITAIAIDGANRKWFGTSGSGLYLISSDNMTQLQHFTTSNSDLLSDNIQSLAINGKTGEVFIGTSKGLCSYISDSSEPSTEMNKDNVYAYPNPVRSEYTGYITITGLTSNADVKITTSNGVLVAQGRSNGGTFTWDGCDEKGERVASGIYMVNTATSDGKKGTVCKIAIIK